jgi:hypothetical protein
MSSPDRRNSLSTAPVRPRSVTPQPLVYFTCRLCGALAVVVEGRPRVVSFTNCGFEEPTLPARR